MTRPSIHEYNAGVVAFTDSYEAAQRWWANKHDIGFHADASDVGVDWENISTEAKSAIIKYLLDVRTDDSTWFPLGPLVTSYELARERFRASFHRASFHLANDEACRLWLAENPNYRARLVFQVMESVLSPSDFLLFVKESNAPAPRRADQRP